MTANCASVFYTLHASACNKLKSLISTTCNSEVQKYALSSEHEDASLSCFGVNN